jgi:hypothetical protein
MHSRIDTRKILLSVIICLILVPGCALVHKKNQKNTELAEQKKSTGSIAGITDFTPGELYKFKVEIFQSRKSPLTFETDSLGRFYISGLEPGVYSLRATGEPYRKWYVKSYFIEQIRVAPGSSSVVHLPIWLSQTMQFTVSRQWEKEIVESDSQTFIHQYSRTKLLAGQGTRGKGNVAGYVFDLNSNKPLERASVKVDCLGETCGAGTDSLGRFFIDNLTSGVYTLCASHIDYHRFCLDGVRVAHDSTSIIEFGMRYKSIPEEPFPAGWEEFIIKCDSACFFEKNRLNQLTKEPSKR